MQDQWDKGDLEGGFAARNIGVSSFIVIISDIIEFLKINNRLDFEKLDAEEIFDLVKPYFLIVLNFIDELLKEDLVNMSNQWGSTGVSKVRREFQRVIYTKYNKFNPDGLLQYIKESSGIYNEETRENIFEIQEQIKDFIFNKLKTEFGEEEDKWWRFCVPKQIQKDCALKSIDTDPPEPPENFLLILDYQKIVNSNWQLLGEFFSPPDIKHGNKNVKLNWFTKFNSIRNRVVHPERQDVTEEEYEFIKKIKGWLLEKLDLTSTNELIKN